MESNSGGEELCFYEILGVPPTSSTDDIKQAYRRLALQMHPDRNRGNEEEARQTFVLIGEAYEVLSDPERRDVYDRFGRQGLAAHDQGRNPADPSPRGPGGSRGSGVEDFFSSAGHHFHRDATFGFPHAQEIFDAFFSEERVGSGNGRGNFPFGFGGEGLAPRTSFFSPPFFGGAMQQQQGFGFRPFSVAPFTDFDEGGIFQQQFQSSSSTSSRNGFSMSHSSIGNTRSSSSSMTGAGGAISSMSSSMTSQDIGRGTRRSVRTVTTVGAGGRSRTRRETTVSYPDGRCETTVEEQEATPSPDTDAHTRGGGAGMYYLQQQHQQQQGSSRGWM